MRSSTSGFLVSAITVGRAVSSSDRRAHLGSWSRRSRSGVPKQRSTAAQPLKLAALDIDLDQVRARAAVAGVTVEGNQVNLDRVLCLALETRLAGVCGRSDIERRPPR